MLCPVCTLCLLFSWQKVCVPTWWGREGEPFWITTSFVVCVFFCLFCLFVFSNCCILGTGYFFKVLKINWETRMDFKLTFCYYIIESLHLQKTHSGIVIAIYDINCQQWIHILLNRERFLKIYFDKTHCWPNKDTGGKTISCRKIFMHSSIYAVLAQF